VLESLPPVEREAGVTVRELLSHTSGVPEYLDRPDARTWIRSELTLDELVASFADRPLDFAPGSRAAYSNSNYVLLAAALERATGKPFETLMEELVFEPAGLRHTRCGGRSEFVPNRALGYELTPDR
jgi:CubicO group peptidase (beta-lactamase class C family)